MLFIALIFTLTILLKIIGSAYQEDAMEVDTSADAVKTILNESSL